jgi:hypothetical protein
MVSRHMSRPEVLLALAEPLLWRFSNSRSFCSRTF